MKVIVDMDRCTNSGMCTTMAAEIFELDDDGELQVLRADVTDDDDIRAVEDAAATCPTQAISLE